jgi:hypothetical protein
MRKLLLLALAALSPSCGGTSTYVFSGALVESPDHAFRVDGAKEKGVIIAMRADRGVGLALPYAEDWVFEPTDAWPVSGKSSALQMFVTVQMHRPAGRVEEESYLKEEYLKNLQASAERRGSALTDVAVTKQGDHFVLEYDTENTMPNQAPWIQTHFWTFRQREDGVIYEAHLSTIQENPEKRKLLSQILRSLLGNNFAVIGARKK